MQKFFKENAWLLLSILVIAVVGGVIANMLTKQVQIDPVSGDTMPGGIATAGKLNTKSWRAGVIK